MSDHPIDPQDYLYGVNVVDIGDYRVSRGETRRPRQNCPHKNMSYDKRERRVYCHDCEQEIEAFDAFMKLVSVSDAINKKIEKLHEIESRSLSTRAAKTMDQHWRKKKTAPLCPHCDTALLPQDIADGLASISKEIEMARRQRGSNDSGNY